MVRTRLVVEHVALAHSAVGPSTYLLAAFATEDHGSDAISVHELLHPGAELRVPADDGDKPAGGAEGLPATLMGFPITEMPGVDRLPEGQPVVFGNLDDLGHPRRGDAGAGRVALDEDHSVTPEGGVELLAGVQVRQFLALRVAIMSSGAGVERAQVRLDQGSHAFRAGALARLRGAGHEPTAGAVVHGLVDLVDLAVQLLEANGGDSLLAATTVLLTVAPAGEVGGGEERLLLIPTGDQVLADDSAAQPGARVWIQGEERGYLRFALYSEVEGGAPAEKPVEVAEDGPMLTEGTAQPIEGAPPPPAEVAAQVARLRPAPRGARGVAVPNDEPVPADGGIVTPGEPA